MQQAVLCALECPQPCHLEEQLGLSGVQNNQKLLVLFNRFGPLISLLIPNFKHYKP